MYRAISPSHLVMGILASNPQGVFDPHILASKLSEAIFKEGEAYLLHLPAVFVSPMDYLPDIFEGILLSYSVGGQLSSFEGGVMRRVNDSAVMGREVLQGIYGIDVFDRIKPLADSVWLP